MPIIPINVQHPEKKSTSDGTFLEVHSIFKTIQGEGPFAGERAIFIRLAGCNLQCPLCDTDYTSTRINTGAHDIVGIVKSLVPDYAKRHLVVITGGEPFRQNIGLLINLLLASRFKVQIETNGTLFQDIPFTYVTVVCSPKTGKVNHQLLPYIHSYKYVLHADSVNQQDGLPITALDHPNSGLLARPPYGFKGNVYLQPVDVKDEAENKRHMEAVKYNVAKFGYIMGIQLHKYIGVE